MDRHGGHAALGAVVRAVVGSRARGRRDEPHAHAAHALPDRRAGGGDVRARALHGRRALGRERLRGVRPRADGGRAVPRPALLDRHPAPAALGPRARPGADRAAVAQVVVITQGTC